MERARIEELGVHPNLVKYLHNMGLDYVDEISRFEQKELEDFFNIKGDTLDYLCKSLKKFYQQQQESEQCQFIEEDIYDLSEPEQLLKETDLFKEFPIDLIKESAAKLHQKSFFPNEVIIKEGQQGDSLYLLKNGLVEVRKIDVQTGIEFAITRLSPLASFGEMSLITNEPRSCSVIAIEESDIYILHRTDFKKLLEEHSEFAVFLADILAKRLRKTNEEKGISYLNLAKFKYDKRVLKLLPKSIILQHKIIPLAVAGSSLTLAMVNPNDLIAFDDIRRFVKGVIIDPVVVTEKDFERFLKNVYEIHIEKEEEKVEVISTDSVPKESKFKQDEPKEEIGEIPEDEHMVQEVLPAEDTAKEESILKELYEATTESPIINLANTILGLAIKNGVSDIHIEPREKSFIVRTRLDGLLRIAHTLPKKLQLPLISRFKIISNMDIAEKRVPQDGRISVVHEDRNIDFRVNTIPCKFGEKIVMRILDKSNTSLGLDKLITRKEQLDKVREMVEQPYGIIFVTGPTGSGKTTTLYSALAEQNSEDVNICTAEDPIEYDMEGINQVQINHKIGLDFAKVLRAFLRQDPDIILVGETRDQETAKVAIEAALTGHLVFTTLHTNDAPGAVTRLREMGVEPFLIGSATIGILAQRLARRLCQNCKVSYTPDEATLQYLGMDTKIQPAPLFYKGEGCPACKKSGFKGRIGIYEVMRLNDEIRRLIASDAKEAQVKETAMANGMKTLMQYSIELLKEGQTTVEEVLRVVAV